MKILIATGIFEPEIGGPAVYASQLRHKLVFPGNQENITIITYSSRPSDAEDKRKKIVRVVRGNRFLNRLKFFWQVNRLLFKGNYDVIYMLDWFAAGLPTALAAKFYGVPYVVRVGGDYLWEQRYLESGKKPVSLTDFYTSKLHRQYRFLFEIIQFVLRGAAHVIFNSDRQCDLYKQYYGLTKTSVIYNPVPKMTVLHRDELPDRREFVFWGRFIVMKNLDTLVRAFAKARLPDNYRLTLIGDGPRKKEIVALVAQLSMGNKVTILNAMERGEAWDRVKDSRALILPSWTDISPNQVYEALALGLPSIVTKENYLNISDKLPEKIDPSSVEDISAKLEMLADDEKYKDFSERFRAISFQNDWDDVLRQHLAIFNRIADNRMRVLQIGADRAKRGILYPDSSATKRQIAYGTHFDELDIIGFSRTSDRREAFDASENVHVFPTNSVSPLLYGLDALEIARTLKKPRVISAQDPFETGFVGWLIALMRGAPLHIQVHTDFLSPEYTRLSFVNRMRVQLAEVVLRRATRVRVVSERILRSIDERFHLEVPVSVIPIYADIERVRNVRLDKELAMRFAQFRTKVLVVSRLEREKNVRLAITAFAKSAPRDACLIIVGGGSERATLEGSARGLGISNRVFFENTSDATQYFALADLLLVPSRYEGYGLVIVEALAAGKPVLSTDVGIARESGAIITSSPKFADALAQWFESGPRRGELKNYPYKNFDDYARIYCADIEACAKP